MREGAVLAAFLVLASIWVAVPAAGQGPQACGMQLEAAEDNPSLDGLRVDQARSYGFVVTNPNQLPAEGEFVIQTSPPPGWFWNQQPQQVELDGGESQTITLSVVYDGTRDLSADLTVAIQDVQCSGLPLGGTSVQGAEPAPVSLSFTHAPVAGPGPVDEGETLWPWFLFGAVVLGTAVGIPIYYRRQRVAVEAFCEDPEREVVPGRGTSFPIVLRNKAKEAAHVRLEVTDVNEGWSALTTLPDLELGPKESRTLYMMVRAPDDARKGDLCVAKLAVTPEGGSTETVSTVSRVVAQSSQKAEGGDQGKE